MTLDHGSRRLLARGVYRNTQNAFDGITVDTEYQKWAIRGFYLLPVSRLPSASALIEDNERAFDKSYSERKIFGFYATSPEKACIVTGSKRATARILPLAIAICIP